MYKPTSSRRASGHVPVAPVRLEGLEPRRLLSAGTFDASFGTGGIVHFPEEDVDVGFRSVVQAPGGRVFAGGFRLEDFSIYEPILVAFTSGGGVDADFGQDGVLRLPASAPDGPVREITDLVLQSDQALLFRVAGGGSGGGDLVVRYDTSGQPDAGFGSNGVLDFPGQRVRFDVSSGGDIVAVSTPADVTGSGTLHAFTADGIPRAVVPQADLAAATGVGDFNVLSIDVGPDGDVYLAGQRDITDDLGPFRTASLFRLSPQFALRDTWADGGEFALVYAASDFFAPISPAFGPSGSTVLVINEEQGRVRVVNLDADGNVLGDFPFEFGDGQNPDETSITRAFVESQGDLLLAGNYTRNAHAGSQFAFAVRRMDGISADPDLSFGDGSFPGQATYVHYSIAFSGFNRGLLSGTFRQGTTLFGAGITAPDNASPAQGTLFSLNVGNDGNGNGGNGGNGNGGNGNGGNGNGGNGNGGNGNGGNGNGGNGNGGNGNGGDGNGGDGNGNGTGGGIGLPVVDTGGNLVVRGTSASEAITLAVENGRVVVLASAPGRADQRFEYAAGVVNRLRVEAGGGNNTLRNTTGLPATLVGGSGNDTLVAGDAGDRLEAGAGNNLLQGGNGRDTFVNGPGDDTLQGGNSRSRFLMAGGGRNVVRGGGGLNTVDYRGRTDDLVLRAGSDDGTDDLGDDLQIAYGGSGNDDIRGFLRAFGGGGDDLLIGHPTLPSALFGGTGNDTLIAGNGGSFLDGGTGTNELRGGTGDDTLVAGDGNHTLDAGTGGRNALDYRRFPRGIDLNLATNLAGVGNVSHTLLGVFTDVLGTRFSDRIVGNGQSNYIDSGLGNDTLEGGDGGKNVLVSAGGRNVFRGGPDFDLFLAGGGRNSVDGGGGFNRSLFDGNHGDEDEADNIQRVFTRLQDLLASYT